ncbi:MAG: SDR family oxidoreductase [Candidatus Latescibacterota bacterium]|jgi:NAD(P)-dependent dehydrogenase (short-subunit alcohol dehydrogenase family)
MGRLSGKVALVTGASQGIGAGIARALANEGASLVLAARDRAKLEQVRGEVVKLGSEAIAVPTDVTDEAQVERLFNETAARFGRLDLLVNNAGAFDGGPLEEVSLASWERVIGTCLTGAFLCTRAAFRMMKPQGGGRVLNLGSISAQRPRLHSAPYTAAKHGIWGLTQATALEGRSQGIVVSCLHPGNVLVERRQREAIEPRAAGMAVAADEPMMSVAEIAAVALEMLCLPPHINLLEAIVLPVDQDYLGRG